MFFFLRIHNVAFKRLQEVCRVVQKKSRGPVSDSPHCSGSATESHPSFSEQNHDGEEREV